MKKLLAAMLMIAGSASLLNFVFVPLFQFPALGLNYCSCYTFIYSVTSLLDGIFWKTMGFVLLFCSIVFSYFVSVYALRMNKKFYLLGIYPVTLDLLFIIKVFLDGTYSSQIAFADYGTACIVCSLIMDIAIMILYAANILWKQKRR